MRFDRFDIDAFGQLHGFRAEALAAHPLIVVHGDSESGKTTLREFLATVLYGFTPAGAGHPYAPWTGGGMEGRAVVQLKDGRALSLERRLRDTADGRVSGEGVAPGPLGNRPLPNMGTVDRAVWDDVHAPRRAPSEGLCESTWALVRQRLLGDAAPPELRSAREAIAMLRARAAELWQPSRRARTRHRELSVRIRRLQQLRDRAAAELNRLLQLREQAAAKSGQASELQEQLVQTRERLARAERLLPVARALQQVEDLRRRADKALPQDDFQPDVRARYTELRTASQSAGERSAALANEIAGHEQRTALSLQDQAVLAAEDEIRTLVGEVPVHQQDIVHVNDLTRERDAQEAVFRERGSHLFSVPLDAERRDVLARLGMGELRSRIEVFDAASDAPELAREEHRQAKEHVRTCELDFEAIPNSDAERKMRLREELLRQLQARDDAWQALKKDVEAAKTARDAAARRLRRPSHHRGQGIALIMAAVCTLLTLFFGASGAWWFVLPAAIGLAAFGWRSLKQPVEEMPVLSDAARAEATRQECLKLREQLALHEFEPVAPHLEKAQQALAHVGARAELERRLVSARQRADECARRVQEREVERERVRQKVVEWLAALPLLPAQLKAPSQDLVHDIAELRDALRAMTRLAGEQQAVAERARERDARAARLAEKLETALHRSPMDAATIWHERLQQAIAARRRAEESGRALPTLREKGRELDTLARAALAELRAYEELLARLDEGGRAEAGLRLVEQARTWRAQADEVESGMKRQFPDWSTRVDEAREASRRGEAMDLAPEQRAQLAGQITQVESALQLRHAELEAVGREREELARRRPLADVDGALAALCEERARVERRHDRLAAQASVLELADQRWREHWQAPVVTAASAYLSELTAGRWERLVIESDDGATRLFVKRWDSETLHEVAEPLSRAVRAQAWLSLRLALAEQLDDGEPLPLVLDDPFADWDAARVKQAAALLATVASRRQVVLLTGQASVAELFEAQVKARVLHLPAPATPGRSRQPDEARTQPLPAETHREVHPSNV